MKRSLATGWRCRWASAVVLLALVGQWSLLVASAAHHAQAAAAAGPWTQVCRAAGGVGPASGQPSLPAETHDIPSPCPVCGATALLAAPAPAPPPPRAPADPIPSSEKPGAQPPARLALPPPARAPPTA
jgi:hypothetical protein